MERIVTIILCMCLIVEGYAQQRESAYRRNSLCPFFITDRGVDNDVKSYIDFACQKYKIPIKYDSHDLGIARTVQIDKMRNKDDEPDFTIKRDPKTGEIHKYSNRANDEDILLQNLEDNKIANKLIAKWFNASDVKENGTYYNMKLIQERGAYSASELEKLRADESVRGRAILADAGMELLSHTYVSFTYFRFTTVQSAGKDMGELGGALLGTRSTIGKLWQAAALENINNNSGYIVTASTYLFRLKWDKSVEDIFISEYYNAPVSKLLVSNDFHMEYVGWASSWPIKYIKKTGKGKKGNALLAEEATIRAIDASLSTLQKGFEDFKVKAPIIDVEDGMVTAFIGKKEGVTSRSKFEVLEKLYNAETNNYKYKRVGVLSVDTRYPIFNNYYVYGQEEEPVGKTYFKGKTSKLAPGMLIRQIK